MSSSSISTATSATDDGDHGGATPITAIHGDVIQSHILNRLDGPTLASTICASAQIFSLCKEDHLWRDICNATWPSTADRRVGEAISTFSSGHRSFYSDSFPALRHHHQSRIKSHQNYVPETSELISAVDIFNEGELIYSKVLVTETLSGWFLNTPFRVDLLDPKETVATQLSGGECIARAAEEQLTVSWILIDPVWKRAVNIASHKAVEAWRHRLTEDIQLRFATVVAGCGGELVQFAVVVTCDGKEGGEVRVRDVSMQVEDVNEKILSGMDSLVIWEEAMAGKRSKRDNNMERQVYEMFLRMKARRRERKERTERGLDMVCTATGVSIFFAVLILLLWGIKILSFCFIYLFVVIILFHI